MNKNGVLQIEQDFGTTIALGDGKLGSPQLPLSINGTNELAMDAWGRQKSVIDYTLFAGLWTFSVPNRMWVSTLQDSADAGNPFIEQAYIPKDNTDVYVKSQNGMLVVTSTNTHNAKVHSKRHIRYQPNRGYLHSTAVILDDPNKVGSRQFGMICTSTGVFFELVGDGTSWIMNTVRRTSDGAGIITDTRTDITASLAEGFDPSKGHVYDIQAQWRGVGNIKFFVDLAKIHTEELLGTLTAMSINNPAMSVAYACIGDGLVIKAGCVDVTSEGGDRAHKVFNSVSTDVLVSIDSGGYDQHALIAVRVPTTIQYGGVEVGYTRDMVLSRVTGFARDEYITTIWTARSINTPSMNALTWEEGGDSSWEFISEDDSETLTTAFKADVALGGVYKSYSIHQETDRPVMIDNASPLDSDIYITAGDIYIFAIGVLQSGKDAGITVEFAEEL